MHRGARARGDERKMSSSDLMGSRGSSWELVGELSAGGLLFPIHRGGAMWPCVAAVGAPLLRPRGSRSSSWRVARALGRLYCTSVRGRVLRTFVRDFCDYCVSCNYTARNMRLNVSCVREFPSPAQPRHVGLARSVAAARQERGLNASWERGPWWWRTPGHRERRRHYAP